MRSFVFDLQRFTAQIISAGESLTLDGVTFTALDGDAELNLDDDGKVSGIASGKVSAVVAGADNSPTVTFDASGGAFNFTATSDGNVITMTPFPIEFISGEFTYTGGTLAITAGSDLALVTKRGDFILRNQNHFVTDSAYIFTSTSLTSESEHVISDFSLTNGNDVRQLQLEQLGTVINYFTQQGFTLVKGSSEVLNIGDYKLTATASNADAGLNMDLGEDGLTFVPNTGDGTLTVALSRNNKTIFDGELECTGGTITLGYDHAVTFAKDTSFNFTTKNNTVLTVTATDEATTNIVLADNGITFTPGSDDGALNISLSKKGTQVFNGSLNITDGTITFDSDEKKFSFTDGTKIALEISSLELEIEVVGDTTLGNGIGASFKIEADENGNLIFTPDENGGSFNISLKRDGSTSAQNGLMLTDPDDDDSLFENNLTVNGEFMFSPETSMLTLKDGTEIAFAFKDYTLTATAQGDAASKISLTGDGISITPQEGDGKLNLALGSANGSMSVDIEVLSGGFLFGWDGALNVVEGTELQIKFSDDYIVNFKATDAAGGAISIGADGLKFSPGSDDGGLQLSVTKNGETRTASLDVTGSLTYKLDGSISLAEDTVVKNVFEDGNILTITANTDASGSIIFNPQNGLTITPSTADALNVVLTTDDLDIVNISSITGSINYSGGIVTASDGTQAHLLIYDEWESELRVSGGTASLQFTADRTVYTANEGATFVLDYLDGSTVEIQNGSFSDIYATDTEDAIELISEGSNFKCNDDEFIFTLETAGNYTINGMNVTTTADNVQVVLADYDTIIINGAGFTALDENVTLTIGETGSTCAGGKVQVNDAFTFDVTDGSISFDNETETFTCAAGSTFYLQDDSDFKVVAAEDFTFTVESGDDTSNLKLTDAELNLVNGTRTANSTITGTIIYGSDGSLALENGTEMNLAWEDGNKLQLTSSGSTGAIGIDPDKGIKITSDDENLAMKFTSAAGYTTEVSSLKGSLWYNAGRVAIEEDTKLTAKGSIGGQAVDVTLEAQSGDGYLIFGTTGITYGADTGALKITYTLGALESTFTVNEGSVFIGHNIFTIAEGTDLATDLKNFIPALNFTTSESGTYTINGQTIKTSAANLALTATDDQMIFTTSDDVVKYDGMTFAGAGNVSLSADNVVLGAGVAATGFGKDKSFVLAEAGNVTADAKVFELAEEVPTGITVTGAKDGFIFSRTTTKESEERLGIKNSPDIGKVFSEKFIAAGDRSYQVKTDLIGLEEVIGMSKGATVTGGATFDNESTLSYYDLITDTDGKFTIGKKTYNVSGDSNVAIRARFDADGSAYASRFASLNGTVSGDFTGGEFSINGSSGLKVFGDTNVSIVADENGFNLLGLDSGASLQVAAAGNYSVNAGVIKAGAKNIIVGTHNGSAHLYNKNYYENSLPNTLITTADLNDVIDNAGNNVTIQGGAGNDYIFNAGNKVLFNYAAGDGNDSIEGFNSTSTLSISGVSYSTTTSGNDVIVTVGESKITLIDAATLSNLNIESDTTNPIETLVEMALKRTAAGYPAMAAVAFHPTEKDGDEPTNYSAKENWNITSADDLNLHAVHYTPEDSNDKWVVLIHGYGHYHDAMYPYATAYLANGYNVLMIDQRAAGDSEGTWLTMGAAESEDVALWTQEIARRNSNAKITLHGVSMGSATAMLAAARADLKNVTALVEDCGYSSVMEVFNALNDVYIKQPSEAIAAMDFVAKNLTGYYLHDAAPIDSISSAKMPSLFISGDADTVVPVSMLTSLYKASGADVKEKFIVEGAGHARSGLDYPAEYNNAVFRFVAEANGEGWITANTADGISLRGTIYDDSISNSGTNITIDTGAGDDFISNYVDSTVLSAALGNSINAGDGNDTIYNNHTYYPTLLGGAGNDSIVVSRGSRTYIDGGAGNDSILGTLADNSGSNWAMGGYATINGGAGDDYISTGYTDNSSISGGSGNDTIIMSGGNSTVSGGKGDDQITIAEDNEHPNDVLITYAKGDGNDIIYGFRADSTLSISGGDYSSTKSGDDLIITVAENEITLVGAASLSAIKINDELATPDSSDKVLEEVANLHITNQAQTIAGNEEVDLRGNDESQIISLGGGNQEIFFNDAKKNIAIIGNAATGEKKIHFGDGGNLGVITGNQTNNFVTLGGGADTLALANNARAQVEMNNSGAANIIPYSGSVTLDNYDASTGAAIQTQTTNITSAVKDNSIQLAGNKVWLDDSTSVALNDSSDSSTLVNLTNVTGSAQIVGFTGINGGSVDTHELSGNVLIKGNYAENSTDNQKSKTSTLTSGDGNDTILAGAGDFVDGGDGNNKIFLTPYDLRQTKDSATIVSSGNGRNIITNFKAGFDDRNDKILIDESNPVTSFDGDNLTIKADSAQVEIKNISSGDDFIKILRTDNTGRDYKTAVAQKGAVIHSGDEAADVYAGDQSGVDFTGYRSSLLADLNNQEDMRFYGINQLTAGDGQSSLIGAASSETLTAGNGETNIWSRAGRDFMVGNSSADKKASTVFNFLAGDGVDTISNFEFLTQDNSSTADKINTGEVKTAFVSGDKVVIKLSDDSALTLNDAAGKDFQINNRIAKVDKNISYDGLANYYVANGGSSLTVNSSVNSAEIWLDNSHDTTFIGKIRTLDASAVEGNTSLVGNEFNNTIIAGHGDSSLWGGSANTDDLLIGGGSRNTFFYFAGNGRDTIQNINDGDNIILSDISLDQIISTEITADSVSINFSDGGSLNVDGRENVTYQLADGSKYSANHERLEWSSK